MTERDPHEKPGAREVPADPAHHQAETVDALEERISAERPDPTDEVEQVAGEDVTAPTRDGAGDQDESATESSG
jgi:hypothetical protein